MTTDELYDYLAESSREGDAALDDNDMDRHIMWALRYHATADVIADRIGFDPRSIL